MKNRMKNGTLMFLAVAAMLLPASCQPNKSKDASAGDAADTLSGVENTMHVAHYRRPEIPALMTDPELRAAYYVNHYWDGYSTADTAFVHSDETEQLYADFIDALQFVDTAEYRAALRTMMQQMERDSIAYAHFCTLGDKYLYHPNSPMRNEDYYIVLLEQMLASPRLSEAEKLRPADRLKQAMKNRPGMKAPDFAYVSPDGKTSRLSRVEADYTLLFFYDPDCTNCQEFERVLSEMPFFLELQEKGVVRVLAIYPDGDEEEWLLKSSQMPEGWIVGWNKQGDIRGKMLYDIRATPTLYLLDKDKRVVLKDAGLDEILQRISF